MDQGYFFEWALVWVKGYVLNCFNTAVPFCRRCSTLHTHPTTWRETSTWTRATKSASTWTPTSSKYSLCASFVFNSPQLTFSFYVSPFWHFSTGAVSARNIQLVKKKQMRCQGVVCATKVSAADHFMDLSCGADWTQ